MPFQLREAQGCLASRTAKDMFNRLPRNFFQAGHDVTLEQWRVLVTPWPRDGRTQQEPAETPVRGNTGITRLVHGMEKRNLVMRVPNGRDRRNSLVYPVDIGKALDDDLVAVAPWTRKQTRRGLDPDELTETP